jgi:hypothetical protein
MGSKNSPSTNSTRPLKALLASMTTILTDLCQKIITKFKLATAVCPDIITWESRARGLFSTGTDRERWLSEVIGLWGICRRHIPVRKQRTSLPPESFIDIVENWRIAIMFPDRNAKSSAPKMLSFAVPVPPTRKPSPRAQKSAKKTPVAPTPIMSKSKPNPSEVILDYATASAEDLHPSSESMDMGTPPLSHEQHNESERCAGSYMSTFILDQLNLDMDCEADLLTLIGTLEEQVREGRGKDAVSNELRKFCRAHSGPGFYDPNQNFQGLVDIWYDVIVDDMNRESPPPMCDLSFLDEDTVEEAALDWVDSTFLGGVPPPSQLPPSLFRTSIV